MTMPPPERLPPLPTATPTPTPTPLMTAAPQPLMTPAQQSVAPPAAGPTPPQIPAKLRAGEMAEPPVEKLGKWEFFAAKHQLPAAEDPFGVYAELSAGERKSFDAEWEEYFYGIAPEGEGAGAAPPLLSSNEERMLIDLQNAVEVGKMDEGQAWKIIENYWSKEETQTRRAEDATRRGSELLRGAHPGPFLPMTGPGGMGAGLQQKYGLPNLTPGVQGLPGSQALGVFGQAQEQLGMPAQLPPLEPPQFQLPNWQAMGQAMPNFGGTNYFDQLLKEGRMTAPGL